MLIMLQGIAKLHARPLCSLIIAQDSVSKNAQPHPITLAIIESAIIPVLLQHLKSMPKISQELVCKIVLMAATLMISIEDA